MQMKSSMTSIRVLYVHREREKVDFKSREVNFLKECALALTSLVVCTELQVLSKTRSCVWFFAYKKYKNGKSARCLFSTSHSAVHVSGGSDNLSLEISRKLPKIATFNAIFSRMAYRIVATFCMIIKKIKPNDTFKNYVHSTSTVKYLLLLSISYTSRIWKYRTFALFFCTCYTTYILIFHYPSRSKQKCNYELLRALNSRLWRVFKVPSLIIDDSLYYYGLRTHQKLLFNITQLSL